MKNQTQGHRPFFAWIQKQGAYQLMIWMAVIFTFIFCYIPMGGLIIAFKDYSIRAGFWGSEWVGLANFKGIFGDFYIGNAILNTIGLSCLDIIISFPATIIFAILINELSNRSVKRVVQTVSYLPHFISWAIMAVLMDSFLNPSDGILNNIIVLLGGEAKMFLSEADLYWPTVVISGLWKELGWSAIVYLAVMTGIDETLYEAAKIDGAGRIARIRYITLPALSGIISIMLILRMGSFINTGFDQAYFLSNPLNFKRSNILSYYVYQVGLRKGNFSYSTAISLVTSTVSATLMLLSNWTAKKINGTGLF